MREHRLACIFVEQSHAPRTVLHHAVPSHVLVFIGDKRGCGGGEVAAVSPPLDGAGRH